MGEVTIIFRDNSQPVIIQDVSSITIRYDTVRVDGRGYSRIYFKDIVKSVTSSNEVRIFIK